MKNTLAKTKRLKSKKQLDLLFIQGKWVWTSDIRLIYFKEEASDKQNNNELIKAGFGVSKKNFKKAVDRNRVKRLLRECYRLQQNIITNEILETKNLKLSLFFLYTQKELPQFQNLYKSVTFLLNKVLKSI